MYARTWASMMLYLPRSDEHASLPIERGKSPQTCHLLSSNKALFVWFWSPNLMDFLMARLPKNQPNQINHSRLNFFSAARCTPCFWCNMISRCGLCLWTRHPHVGIRWEVILGFPGSFLTNDIPQKRLVLQSDMIVRKWHWNVEFLIVIGRVL